MILVDFSGLAIATIVVNKVDDEDLLRHMILNSLRMYRNSYKDKFGELVLCCDGKNNWRRGYYPQYKANRKKKREADTFDWAKAFEILTPMGIPKALASLLRAMTQPSLLERMTTGFPSHWG